MDNPASPPIIREILPSGLTVIIEKIPHVRSVALGYSLRSGSARESSPRAGASHFLEHLVFKATPTRSTGDIAREIDALGGDVDAFTGKENTSFHAHVLDEQVESAFDLLTDIVLRPQFTDVDLEMERSVVLEEIHMVEDTPDDLVHEVFIEKFWPDHPLGRPILGTEDSVRGMARDELEAHYAETFHPANMIFCASGNVDPAFFLDGLSRSFESADGAFQPVRWETPEVSQNVTLRQKGELEQVHLCLGMTGVPLDGEERFAAAIFNTILGGGMSSRLFQRIREREGLAYSIASFHAGHAAAGCEMIYAACASDNLPRLIDSTMEELATMKRNGVTSLELHDAKRNLKGSILLSLESTVSRMSGLTRQECYFGRLFDIDEIIQSIEAVSSDDVAQIASRIIDRDSIAMTLLGNLDEPGVSIEDLRSRL